MLRQLPVVAALLASLALNKIGIVQTLDRRQGAVFYLNLLYGQDKGSLSEGDNLISAKTGHDSSAASRKYATELVVDESLTNAQSCTGTLDYKPVRSGTLVITDGDVTFTANGSGVLVPDDSALSNGTINLTTGAYACTFAGAPATTPTGSYRYNYEKESSDAGVPEVDVDLTSETLEAIDFPLRAKYTMGAAIDLEKAHGLVLEDEIIKYLSGEIKFEVDHYGIQMIADTSKTANAAAGTNGIGAWDATIADGQEWLWRKYMFLDMVEKGSNAIFAKTLRGMASFILAGNNVARVIRQLEPHFKPAPGLGSTVPTGPFELGTLDGRLVIQDPFLPTNQYTLGFKGDSYLFAGFIYAPYIPLFATPTLVTSDLKAQKGFMSSAGFKVINPGLYTYGTVSGLQ